MNTIKCVIVGDGTVGKTCLLLTYTANCFPQDYIPTVFDNYCANVMINGKVYNLGLWDTAGQEEYDHLRPLSYANTDIFIVCFSVISETSFNNVRSKWIPEIISFDQKSKYVLVGTKTDLRDTNQSASSRGTVNCAETLASNITYEQGYNLAKEINAIKYIECSALEQKNISLLFTEMARAVVCGEKCKKNKDK